MIRLASACASSCSSSLADATRFSVSPCTCTPRASEQVLELGDLEPDDKLLCLKLAIKTADLSYLSKGHAYVQVWTDRVLEEFFAQVTCRAIVDQPCAARAWARPAPAAPRRHPCHRTT